MFVVRSAQQIRYFPHMEYNKLDKKIVKEATAKLVSRKNIKPRKICKSSVFYYAVLLHTRVLWLGEKKTPLFNSKSLGLCFAYKTTFGVQWCMPHLRKSIHILLHLPLPVSLQFLSFLLRRVLVGHRTFRTFYNNLSFGSLFTHEKVLLFW